MLRTRSMAVLIAVSGVGLLACQPVAPPRPNLSPPAVPDGFSTAAVVDVSYTDSVVPQSGGVNGLTAQEPDSWLLNQLRPQWWRGWPSERRATRVQRAGGRYQAVLSDSWGYPATGWQAGGYGGSPTQFPQQWRAHVVSAYAEMGEGVNYDLWNEPDKRGFWDESWDKSVDVMLAAEAQLRSTSGGRAQVSGPSISEFDLGKLTNFLDRCVAVGCRLRYLSWHELLGPNSAISEVGDHIAQARQLIARPAYASIGVKDVMINEIIGPIDQYRPGEHLAYFATLEKAQSSGAMRACWDDHEGSQCNGPTLGGLLDRAGRRRPIWYVMRRYGELGSGRYPNASSGPGVVIAGPRADGGHRVLIGSHRVGADDATPLTTQLRLQGLTNATVQVNVSVLLDLGGLAGDPRVVVDTSMSTSGGAVVLNLPAVPEHSVLVVDVIGI